MRCSSWGRSRTGSTLLPRVFSCAPSECISRGTSCLAACLVQRRLLADVELLHMQPWVGVPAAGGGAQLALVNRFDASVGAGLEYSDCCSEGTLV